MQKNNKNNNKKLAIGNGRFQESITAAVARTIAATKKSDAFIYVSDSKDATNNAPPNKSSASKKKNMNTRKNTTPSKDAKKESRPQKKRNEPVPKAQVSPKKTPIIVSIEDKTKISQIQNKSEAIPVKQEAYYPFKKKEKFEIDNSNIPNGLPPILPFDKKKTEAEARKPASRNGTEPFKGLDLNSVSDANISKEIDNSLDSTGSPATIDEISGFLGLNDNNRLFVVLSDMISKGELFLTKRKKYALPSQIGYISGKLQVTSKGYGFLICDDSSDDVFIAEKSLNSAMNGDQVLANVDGKKGEQRSGTVVFVLKRAQDRIIGTIDIFDDQSVLIADSDRIKSSISIHKKNMMSAKKGQKVVAEFDYSSDIPDLKIVEILGDSGDPGIDVLSIIKSHGIDIEFPRGVIQSAGRASKYDIKSEIAKREDLRNIVTFTIDGADAKDFDDAISCEINSKGNYNLGVHIADVSYYVKENSSMDKEARKRCNSVYVIDKVVPMLPETISNGVCSLQEREDRLTLSCFVEVSKGGDIVSHRFSKSVISSHKRMIYDDVSDYLESEDPGNHFLHEFDTELRSIEELARILNKKRNERGSINFDISESQIVVDNTGKVSKIQPIVRGESNSIIEEFMLICNEVVAEHMTHIDEPMIYRIHDVPDLEKQESLFEFLGSLGYSIPKTKGGIKPKQLQEIIEQVKDKPEEEAVSRFMLRSMQKAKYSPENLGHFGLAAQYYCHFTAPIRRYSDLVVHRILKKHIDGELNNATRAKIAATLPEIAEACSDMERLALECERDVADLKKAEYMSNFIGKQFNGKISGITGFGMFIELENTCEGLVRISDMNDDYYVFYEKKLRLIGERTRKEYTIGDIVEIRVEHVDVLHRKVDFSLVLPKNSSRRRKRGR